MKKQVDIQFPILETFHMVEETGYTYVKCIFKADPKFISGWWVNISPTSYLVNPTSGEKLKLIHAINIPIAPEKKFLISIDEDVRFILVFPKIPKDWNKFYLQEQGLPEENLLLGNLMTRNDSGINYAFLL